MQKRKRIKDRVLLLLSIKEEGRVVEFNHIFEKVSRNAGGALESEVENALAKLRGKGFVKKIDHSKWKITDRGRNNVNDLLHDPNMNLSYRRVLQARQYYSNMMDYVVDILQGKTLAVIKLFSHGEKPLDDVKKVFSRFSQRQPPVPHRVENKVDLKRYVNIHTVEFLYVVNNPHIDSKWFVLNLFSNTSGKKPIEAFLKEVTKVTVKLLKERADLAPLVTFSGNKGFNIFCKFKSPLGPWQTYKRAAKTIKKMVESYLESENNLKYPLLSLRESELTNENENYIVYSFESTKPNNPIITPLSLHWKTGLVAIPLSFEEIKNFRREKATPQHVINHKKEYKVEIVETSPKNFAKELKLGLYQFFNKN